MNKKKTPLNKGVAILDAKIKTGWDRGFILIKEPIETGLPKLNRLAREKGLVENEEAGR